MKADVLKALTDNMVDLHEGERYIKALWYGEGGAGKTTAAASIGERVLFIEADPGGWDSLFNHPEISKPGRITRMRYQGLSQLESIADAFVEGIPQFNEFDTLVLDTASYVSHLDLSLVIHTRAKKKGLSDEAFEDGEMWPAHRQVTERIRTAFLKLGTAPVNFCATAHMTTRKMNNGAIKITPDFTPAITTEINRIFKLIVYMTASEAGVDSDGSVKYERRGQFHPTPGVMAKSHIGGLPSTVDNPNYRKIIQDWQAKGGKLLSDDEVAKQLIPEEMGLAPKSVPSSEDPVNSSSDEADLFNLNSWE